MTVRIVLIAFLGEILGFIRGLRLGFVEQEIVRFIAADKSTGVQLSSAPGGIVLITACEEKADSG